MTIVADYSGGFPGAKALKEAGFIGAVRYIGSPGNIKCATAAELRDFLANGISMSLVFEQTAGQWRYGYSQGQRDAIAARAHASDIGYPLNRPIYFAIDQDVVTADEFKQVDAYADGWASVLGHDLCGPYGEYAVVARCWNRGFKWTWQCRAWSGSEYFAQRKLFQYYGSPYTPDGRNVVVNGIEVDTNEVNAADWGQTGGSTMSKQDVFDAFAYMAANPTSPEAECVRQVITQYKMPKVNPEGPDDTETSIHAETMWISENFRQLGADIAELKTSGVPVNIQLSAADKADIAKTVLDGLRGRLES
jgi:Rv2525c-like, glycoside hydrolase-like domain